MRQARIRIDDAPCWYHCYNRVAGTRHDRPFGEVEKEQFARLLKRVARLYCVRVVAYQVLSNHFHLLLHAPDAEPDEQEICRRYKNFHRGRRTLTPGSPACRDWQARSRDISWFMRHLQQLFTVWYNRSRPEPRRGSLWADRFKHTLLEGGSAVWACWAYIENNPVRAGIVKRAADYRFGSYGIWMQSGRHPFAEEVQAAALPMFQETFGLRRLEDIRQALGRTLAGKAEQQAMATVVERRVRYWTQGLVIGSRLFVDDVRWRCRTVKPSRQCPTVCMDDLSMANLYCWRRLRPADTA